MVEERKANTPERHPVGEMCEHNRDPSKEFKPRMTRMTRIEK